MKLLTPKENRDKKEEEVQRYITRYNSVKEALKEAESQLNNADATFEIALTNQRLRWANEEKDAAEKIVSLRFEIAELENAKKAMLIPIDRAKQEAHNLFKEAEDKRQEADILLDLLQQRLDEVSEREEEVKRKESELLVREKGIEGQANMIKYIKNNG